MIFATNVSSNAPNTDPTNDIHTVAGTILNVAESVIVEARMTDGRTLRLPVEYAGTLVGLAEIDQVNVMLLSELQGAGSVELTIKIGAYQSNTATIFIR
jgi:uncharacterized protein (TIGR03437 family)